MIQFQHGIINSLEFNMAVAGAGDLAVSAYVGIVINGIEVLIPAPFDDNMGKQIAEIPNLPVEENAPYILFTEVRIGSRFYRPYSDTCMFIKPMTVSTSPPIIVVTTESSQPLVAAVPVPAPKPFRPQVVEKVAEPVAKVVEKKEPVVVQGRMSLADKMEHKRKSDIEQAAIESHTNKQATDLGESLKAISFEPQPTVTFDNLVVKPSLKK